MEITECLQNFWFYGAIISDYLSLWQKSYKKLLKSEDFLFMTYVEKASYFEDAPPGHIDNLIKNGRYIS